jgi:hypothetical protein
MNGIIPPRVHGILDYVTVVAFAAAPSLVGLDGSARILAYTLAAVHLTLTLITAFPLGVAGIVPFRVHGAIELLVSISLVAVPWLLGFAALPAARNFYVGAGAAIFVVWLLTRYRD